MLKTSSALLTVALVTSIAGNAAADQCQLVDQDTALEAESLLETGTRFLRYCSTCGETPVEDVVVSFHAVNYDNHFYEFQLVGEKGPVEIADLAYLFVADRTSDGTAQWVNVGWLTDCEYVCIEKTLSPEFVPGDFDCKPADPSDGNADGASAGEDEEAVGCNVGGAGNLWMALAGLGFLARRRRR